MTIESLKKFIIRPRIFADTKGLQMSNTFKTGDIVKLKSGGPEMTVFKWVQVMGGCLRCQWFAGKKLEVGDFQPDQLEVVKSSNP